jgi:glutamate formiminotransferase/formiminotetrahydrofolate cyclodeaminase
VDEDTRSFDRIMAAMQLPKGTPDQVEVRKSAIREATKGAIMVPLRTLELCVESMGVIKAMAEQGLKASASDAGVGALCARTGAIAAYLNVRTNCSSLDDDAWKKDVLARAEVLKKSAEQEEGTVLATVLGRI